MAASGLGRIATAAGPPPSAVAASGRARDAVPGPHGSTYSVIERERRLFGDSQARWGPTSTQEYTEAWVTQDKEAPQGTTLHRRRKIMGSDADTQGTVCSAP